MEGFRFAPDLPRAFARPYNTSMLTLLTHRQARFEYEPLETFLAGIVLSGGEVKMLRQKKGSLSGSHVRVINNELVLLNAQIPPYPFARNEEYDPIRTRKLLMHKREILKLQEAQQEKGKALIPLAIVLEGKHIKVKLSIARGKTQRDRREEIRRRDLDRQAAKELKG